MFCMSCGAEVANHLTACPNCGKPIALVAGNDGMPGADSSPSRPSGQLASNHASGVLADAGFGNGALAAAMPALSSQPLASALVPPAQPVVALPAVPALPSIGAGDLGGTLLPRDALGRMILATAVAMAVDVLAPWVVVSGRHVPLAHVGAPVFALLAALLVPLVAVRPRFRKQPIWAAAPLVLGSMFLGGGIGVLVLLAWLAPRVELIGTSAAVQDTTPGVGGFLPTATNTPAYTADVGLYLFLVGAALLMIAGYQLLLAAREGQRQVLLVPASMGLASAYAAYPVAPVAAQAGGTNPPAADPMSPGADMTSTAAVMNGAVNGAVNGATPAVAAPTMAPTTPPSAAPAQPARGGPVLPGTAAWNRPQDAPSAIRTPSPGSGFPRPLGPRPGR